MADIVPCQHSCRSRGSLSFVLAYLVDTAVDDDVYGTCHTFSHRYCQRSSNFPFPFAGRPAKEAPLDALWIRSIAPHIGDGFDLVLLCAINDSVNTMRFLNYPFVHQNLEQQITLYKENK